LDYKNILIIKKLGQDWIRYT